MFDTQREGLPYATPMDNDGWDGVEEGVECMPVQFSTSLLPLHVVASVHECDLTGREFIKVKIKKKMTRETWFFFCCTHSLTHGGIGAAGPFVFSAGCMLCIAI